MANKSYHIKQTDKFIISNYKHNLYNNYEYSQVYNYNSNGRNIYNINNKYEKIKWTEMHCHMRFILSDYTNQIESYIINNELKIYDSKNSACMMNILITDKKIKYTLLNNKLYMMQHNNHIMSLDRKIDMKFENEIINDMYIYNDYIILNAFNTTCEKCITYILSANDLSIVDKLDNYTLYNLTHDNIIIFIGFFNNLYKCYYYNINNKIVVDSGYFVKWQNNDTFIEFIPNNVNSENGNIIIKSIISTENI